MHTTPEEREDWVHNWLDAQGVPKEFPDGEHSKCGCRIGDRMEWLSAALAKAESERDYAVSGSLEAVLEKLGQTRLYEANELARKLAATEEQVKQLKDLVRGYHAEHSMSRGRDCCCGRCVGARVALAKE